MFKKYLIPLVVLVAAALPFACGGGATSGRQQTCSNSGDCKDGLLCVNQTCIQNDYPVEATAKECIVIECEADADCCANFEAPNFCAQYIADCADQGAGGFFGFDPCETANGPACTCTQKCDQQLCVTPQGCESDDECTTPGLPLCDTAASACVECLTVDDCDAADGEKCIANVCDAGCEVNEDCPLFHSCTAGECKDTGCTSDRECILFTRRSDSVCKAVEGSERKQCSVPCTENAECGPLQLCKEGECMFLGCETAEECRTYLGIENEDDNVDFGQPKQRAACVDLNPAN